RPLRYLPAFRTILTLPLFVPAIAIGSLATTFVTEGGPINSLLLLAGLPKPLGFLSDPFWAFVAVAMVDVWQWTPFAFLVLLAGLQSLPDEIYEASALDTDSSWQVFRYVTLPLLAPVVVTVILLRTVEAFKVLDIPFALTSGGPGSATRTYTMYTYIIGLR